MKLIFLGSGSAFTVGYNNYHSNMILESSSKHRLLIDCGSDARHGLYDLGLSASDIDAVYISHLHADHVGGLEWLAFSTKFDDALKKPKLYINENLSRTLWNKILSFGLNSIKGLTSDLSTYFDVKEINEGQFFWESIQFTLIPTIHVMSGNQLAPSYGLIFIVDGLTILITTDSQFVPDYFTDLYERADLIFQDCETAQRHSGVHAHYRDLVTLNPTIKKKMWLYHYNPGTLPEAKRDGFLGFVKKGQCFDFNDKKTLR